MQELSPAQMLEEYLLDPVVSDDAVEYDPIADETLDPTPRSSDYDSWRVQEYLSDILRSSQVFPLPFAAQYTKIKIGQALTDVLWRGGSFDLGNVVVDLHWHWHDAQIGNMAAFYSSVQAASECVDSLGIRIGGYSYEQSDECDLTVRVSLAEDETCEQPRLSVERACPEVMTLDPDSYLMYVPVDNSDYRLGGSLLSQTLGMGGSIAPELYAPDYFIDCYEVLREMVEDGILLSGVSVEAGGLMTALHHISGGTGVRVNISGVMKALDEPDMVRILFSEVPGVVIQIREEDYDYVDAEFTLQDVMYFPLGHPEPGRKGVKVETTAQSSIQSILESLIRSQSSEGED